MKQHLHRRRLCWYLGLQKNRYWIRRVAPNMTAPWIAMAQRFFPTMSQPRGSWNLSSPENNQNRRMTPTHEGDDPVTLA